jgi:pyruvate kinase
MLSNFSNLLDQVDGTYLSRSELGTIVHPHSLPITQKEIISKCNSEAKIVMIASELMHSMQVNPNPTRAEVSDLANAVSDGADALVLEPDVTEGPYPDEVAKVSQETVIKSEPKMDDNWHPCSIRNRAKTYSTQKRTNVIKRAFAWQL